MIKSSVMIVDDEEGIRESLSGIFEDEGHEVLTAGSGEEALRALKEQTPDLILLDLHLPDSSGEDILRRLKIARETAAIPVVMLTSKGTAFDRVRGLMAGTDVYLTKPLDRGQLIQALSNCLTAWQQPVAANLPTNIPS